MKARLGRSEPVPETFDHLDAFGLHFDSAGRLWVQTSRRSEQGEEPRSTAFDLFGADHEYLGEVIVDVALIARSYPLTMIRGDVLAGVDLADEGAARIGVWRIVG